MIKVIQTSTQEREAEFQETYQRFRDYYDNTDMLIHEILAELGLPASGSTYKRISRMLRREGLDTRQRGRRIREQRK